MDVVNKVGAELRLTSDKKGAKVDATRGAENTGGGKTLVQVYLPGVE